MPLEDALVALIPPFQETHGRRLVVCPSPGRPGAVLSGSVQESDGEEVILGLVRDVDFLEHDSLGPCATNDEALVRTTT